MVDDPNGASIATATWSATSQGGRLAVAGTADSRQRVTIRNAVTQATLFVARADRAGDFDQVRSLTVSPCWVQAGVDGVFGPATEVAGAPETCDGPDTGGEVLSSPTTPVTPSTSSTQWQATKSLVAWPSRFCTGGSPVFGDTFPRDEVADLSRYRQHD